MIIQGDIDSIVKLVVALPDFLRLENVPQRRSLKTHKQTSVDLYFKYILVSVVLK